jgi:hypothetical protein
MTSFLFICLLFFFSFFDSHFFRSSFQLGLYCGLWMTLLCRLARSLAMNPSINLPDATRITPLPPPVLTRVPSFTTRMEFDFDTIEEEDSPFPEVRASVSNVDDPDMPAMTLRMWFVGLTLCLVST